MDRPLNSTIVSLWEDEIFKDTISDVEEERAYFEKSGIVTIWPDYDHSVPEWDRLLSLGFLGILEESEKQRKKKNCTEKENAFYV